MPALRTNTQALFVAERNERQIDQHGRSQKRLKIDDVGLRKDVEFIFVHILGRFALPFYDEIAFDLALDGNDHVLQAAAARSGHFAFDGTADKQGSADVAHQNMVFHRLRARVGVGAAIERPHVEHTVKRRTLRRGEEFGGNLDDKALHYRPIPWLLRRSRQRRTLVISVSRLCSTWPKTSSA